MSSGSKSRVKKLSVTKGGASQATGKKPATSRKSGESPQERRRAVRRPLLDSFSLFVVVPKKGGYRLKVHDVSDFGLGFDLDAEGESASDFPAVSGDRYALRFYLNQTLYLPLQVQLVRIEEKGRQRRVGVEIVDRSTPGYRAFAAFLRMLDALHEGGRMDSESL
jgi:hypothetical protein